MMKPLRIIFLKDPNFDPDPEDFAQGGRVGYDGGFWRKN